VRPRIAVGGFAQESNSFSPVPGSWAHFGPGQVFTGQEMIQHLGRTRTELGGAFDLAQGWEVELVPLLDARASSSAGPMQNDVFEGIRDELLEWLDRAGPVQGVLLVLHGAMVVEGYEDGTGEVLRAVRAAVGPQIPVVGTLDLHANVTQLMVEQATALVGFHTAPHVDLYETGQRGMRLLIQTVVGHVSPRMGLARLPMILPGEAARTTDGPLAEVMSQAHALMERPEVLDVSVFSVQPWLDVHDVGCSVLVVTDGDGEVADRYADQLAQAFW
jgi:microcystin degradation protein MlrC